MSARIHSLALWACISHLLPKCQTLWIVVDGLTVMEDGWAAKFD